MPPDSPRTAKRKELDRLYPPLEYNPDKKKTLKPLSPRSKAKYNDLAKEIYAAKRGPNGEIMSEELRARVQQFRNAGEPDFRDLANQIYHAETPGMEQRAMRNLRHTEGQRDQRAYRAKAFELYKAETGQNTFIRTAQEIQDDPHFQRETAADELGDCLQTLQLNHDEIARELEAAEPGQRGLELEAPVAVALPEWRCPLCTFINRGGSVFCEMCRGSNRDDVAASGAARPSPDEENGPWVRVPVEFGDGGGSSSSSSSDGDGDSAGDSGKAV